LLLPDDAVLASELHIVVLVAKIESFRGASMYKAFHKLMMISVLAVVGLATTAVAQQKPQAPENRPSNLRPGNGWNRGDSPSQPSYIGWNYFHVTNCDIYLSGGYTWLVVYPQEGGYFWTVYPTFQNLLQPACQTGNLIALYVYDSNNDWNQIYTYSYR
jgi:hypothetical protein